MAVKMLINAREPEESRIAVVENGRLMEFYIERLSQGRLVGNIYKARVVNTEPSLQAAFVDFGFERNGFLHASDIVVPQRSGRKHPHKRQRGGRPSVQSLLKPGEEIVVQVTKDGIRDKGPSVTQYLSLPGRFVVLMPDRPRQGVSRKITNEAEREKLRSLMSELEVPENMGVIVRTAGAEQTKRELSRDVRYLLRLWNMISKRVRRAKAPALIYQESDLVIRSMRDILSPDIKEVIIDVPDVYELARDFLRQVMPKSRKIVSLYNEPLPLFHKYGIEEELRRINDRKVLLKNGGSLVIEQTEALVAIDVNSGKFKKESNPEETAFKTDLEAAREIARQIRLRDLGGVIVNDFIDMREDKHKREVERTLMQELKKDRARTKMLRMSSFGTIEMTRQRMRQSVRRTLYVNCPYCHGTGLVQSVESTALNVLREAYARAVKHQGKASRLELVIASDVAEYIQNEKRKELLGIEEDLHVRVLVHARSGFQPDELEILLWDEQGNRLRA